MQLRLSSLVLIMTLLCVLAAWGSDHLMRANQITKHESLIETSNQDRIGEANYKNLDLGMAELGLDFLAPGRRLESLPASELAELAIQFKKLGEEQQRKYEEEQATQDAAKSAEEVQRRIDFFNRLRGGGFRPAGGPNQPRAPRNSRR